MTNADSTESWRPIPGYEGHYEVSDLGRVRSVERRRVDGRQMIRARTLKPVESARGGYPSVHLRLRGHSRCHNIHVLVLLAFVGPRPSGWYGCHNNGDRHDNRLANLRWDTPRGNSLDKVAHGTQPESNRAECPRGHRLVEPNIVPWEARRGHRACRACARARAHAHHYGAPFDPALAQRKYEDIMREAKGLKAREADQMWADKRAMQEMKGQAA